jgi:hypothetical protein
MPSDYELYVRHEVYEMLRMASRSNRRRVIAFLETLPADPFHEGDYNESDQTGRECQVEIVGKYAVYFRVDHAVREVRVVDLIDADTQ